MKTIWFLPLEPLHQRYTEQMYRWVVASLRQVGLPFRIVQGGKGYDRIKHGQWLDTSKTTIWKLKQLAALSESIASGDLKKGDLVLLGDVWMPGIEAIKFQSDLLGLDIKIGGWHYAGCFDHFDFLAKGLGSWGPKYEQALVEGVLDSVCFGSPFHKAFVERHCRLPRHASTEGLAWDHYEVAAYAVTAPKPKPIVAFTHRWAAEKRHGEFLRLARSHKGKRIQFVISTNGEATPEMIAEAAAWNCRIVQHKTKADYYKWLATVRIMWSGADQETFGYSFMESVALGRKVVAPMRACYPDHFTRLGIDPADWLYNDRDPFGAGMLHRAMTYKNECIVPAEVSLQYHNAHDRYIRQFVEACA